MKQSIIKRVSHSTLRSHPLAGGGPLVAAGYWCNSVRPSARFANKVLTSASRWYPATIGRRWRHVLIEIETLESEREGAYTGISDFLAIITGCVRVMYLHISIWEVSLSIAFARFVLRAPRSYLYLFICGLLGNIDTFNANNFGLWIGLGLDTSRFYCERGRLLDE